MIKVVELFAGVGGFRVGLNHVKLLNDRVIEKNDFKIVFFNQWEPSTSKQYAYECYVSRFNEKTNDFNNIDITKIDKSVIPNHDLLVGGFPCQDYSVARTLKGEKGIEGKKGVLWWEIYKTLSVKNPNFVLLENVDRLLISPSKQKGRDFGVMLNCFKTLGYCVEWKVINAADYGMPQKRKRLFIFAYKKSTNYFKKVSSLLKNKISFETVFDFFKKNKTFFTSVFETEILPKYQKTKLNKSLKKTSDVFLFQFYDSGIMIENKIFTFKTKSLYEKEKKVLKDIILKSNDVDKSFFINDQLKIEKFKYLKNRKKEIRYSKNGYKYNYSEGKMAFPEKLELPGRTMLTSEGSINRSTHVIKDANGNYRFLTPVECERLNTFPDNWTKNMPDKTRYFLMGNALVCDIVKKLSKNLKKIIECDKEF